MTSPSETAVRLDVTSPRFLLGIDQQRWSQPQIDWPEMVVDVAASGPGAALSTYTFRFDLTGYPNAAPSSRLWDRERNSSLPASEWPTGQRSSVIFNPRWTVGGVYHPMDRLAQAGHEAWRNQDPHSWWNAANHTIVNYLHMVSAALNETNTESSNAA